MECAIFLLLICWFPDTGFASLCRTASYSVQDQVLTNHTIQIEPTERMDHCIIRCMQHPGCHSSNFYRNRRLCELNDKTHASHPADMRQVYLTNYMENTLRPLPCNNDSDCGSYLVCLSSLKCGGKSGD